MSAPNAAQKGNALEDAVHAIETLILRSNPATKDATITIEPKKTVIVDGVKHEIDIYITIDLGHGYKSVYIFECKNWQETVGKNEIIVFSEKINAVQAQKGYFIAKKFGRYAQAQAKKDKRIELLTASDALASLPPFVNDFHFVQNVVVRSDITFRLAPDDPQKIGTLTVTNESFVKYKNEDLLVGKFNERMQNLVVDGFMNRQPTALFGEGVYNFTATKTLVFQPDELFLEGIACIAVDAHVTWDTHVIRPTIVSAFDIQTRGRTITFESVKLPSGGDITTSFIAIE
jgi:hypothetical protein